MGLNDGRSSNSTVLYMLHHVRKQLGRSKGMRSAESYLK